MAGRNGNPVAGHVCQDSSAVGKKLAVGWSALFLNLGGNGVNRAIHLDTMVSDPSSSVALANSRPGLLALDDSPGTQPAADEGLA